MPHRARRHRRSRQRRHHAALQARRLHLLESAIGQTTDAIVITTARLDPPGPQIVFVNPAFCALTGYPEAALLGRTPRLLQGPATDRAELDRVRHALAQGRPYVGEVINYRRDGQAYVLRWHLAPIRDPAGTITHWVSIQREVTAERAAAAERQQLLDTTQHALAVRDTFLNTFAHELRTPLTALLGYSHLLQHAVAGTGPPAVARYAALIGQHTARFAAVITELLELEQLEAGTALTTDTVDLRTLTHERTAAFDARLTPAHALEVTVPPAMVLVLGDDARLRYVLDELLTNALMFSPHGGTIAVTLAMDAGGAELTVRDQGIGIPQAALTHVRERFFRASNVDPHRMPGFGIGLYAISAIITRHGGQLHVESAEGQGTTVRLLLPPR